MHSEDSRPDTSVEHALGTKTMKSYSALSPGTTRSYELQGTGKSTVRRKGAIIRYRLSTNHDKN